MNTTWDLIIVGSGIAGLSAALEAEGLKTLILTGTKEGSGGSSSRAQGGIACALDQADVSSLIADTLASGAGSADRLAVEVLVKEGLESLPWMESKGIEFDRGRDGLYQRGQEGAHSRRRVLHIGGDATGRGLQEPLLARVKENPLITLQTGSLVVGLLGGAGPQGPAIAGVRVLEDSGTVRDIFAPRVLIASGGLGQLFGHTTNPLEVRGLCHWLAWQAGVPLADLEMVQFHPTGLDAPLPEGVVDSEWLGSSPLLSEALRGEGAVLVDSLGQPIPIDHPMGSLGSRDIVARSIHKLLAQGKKVFLDTRPIHRFHKKFPTISRACALRGLDPVTTPLPVVPVVHYHMGGDFD